jgi:hypothetical protein
VIAEMTRADALFLVQANSVWRSLNAGLVAELEAE